MTVLGQVARQVRNAVAPLRSVFNDHVRHTMLSNGLHVLSQNRDSQERSNFQYIDRTQRLEFALRINVGSYDDPIQKIGVAHFLEHVLFKPEILNGFEDRDGFINARTSPEEIVIHGAIDNTPENLDFMMQSLSDMLSKPIDRERFEREKNRIQNEIGSRDDDPKRVLAHMYGELFDDDQGTLNILGSREVFDQINYDDLNDFKSKWFKAPGMALAVTGIKKHSTIHRIASQMLGGVSSDIPPDVANPVMTPKKVHEAADHLKQVYFGVTYPLENLTRRERRIATLAMACLDDRINREVIREQGLAYEHEPKLFWNLKGNGAFSISGNIMPEQGDRILKPIADIVGQLSVQIDPATFARVQRRIHNNIPGTAKNRFSPHEPDKMARDVFERGAVERNQDAHKVYESITAEEVSAFMKKLVSQTPALITYGDADKMQSREYFFDCAKAAAQSEYSRQSAENGMHLT